MNFAARKARGRQIQIGKRQHVALNAALFLFVERHYHEHRGEDAGQCRDRIQRNVKGGELVLEDIENETQSGPQKKDRREQPVRQSFLETTLYPKLQADGGIDGKGGEDYGESEVA